MDQLISSMDEMVDASDMVDMPQLTISPEDTTLQSDDIKSEESQSEDRKSVKKRKSWGQELPTPKTNLPPRKRAKTEDEKEQRRIERVLRNRAAAQTSRERKRLEVEKLEGEKERVEEQNAFLLQRLAQMETENNRLNRQVAQLSAEIRSSRGSSPKSVTSAYSVSPTLTPTLFKQERDDMPLEKIPFPTPSISDFSPSLKPVDLAESTDLTQHPAEMLCDPQCQSKDSKDRTALSPFWTPDQVLNLKLQMTLQLLFLTMTSAACSTVILPLTHLLHSLKTGSPLTFSPEEICQHLPLIHWLISTPTLSTSASMVSTPRSVFRMRLLTRLLACSPALARPLRDATGKALQLAVRESSFSDQTDSTVVDSIRGLTSADWTSWITMAWAIDSIDRSTRRHMRRRQQRKLAGHKGMKTMITTPSLYKNNPFFLSSRRGYKSGDRDASKKRGVHGVWEKRKSWSS